MWFFFVFCLQLICWNSEKENYSNLLEKKFTVLIIWTLDFNDKGKIFGIGREIFAKFFNKIDSNLPAVHVAFVWRLNEWRNVKKNDANEKRTETLEMLLISSEHFASSWIFSSISKRKSNLKWNHWSSFPLAFVRCRCVGLRLRRFCWRIRYRIPKWQKKNVRVLLLLLLTKINRNKTTRINERLKWNKRTNWIWENNESNLVSSIWTKSRATSSKLTATKSFHSIRF